MANDGHDKVQLGCGTLILIALIVMISSGRGDINNLKSEIKTLRQEISVLGDKVDVLTRAIEATSPGFAERVRSDQGQSMAPEAGGAAVVESGSLTGAGAVGIGEDGGPPNSTQESVADE